MSLVERLSKDTYSAALIIVGNEILAGRTQDTNTPWIAERLTEKGVLLHEVRIVPDNEAVIISTIQELKGKYTYVFTTGGIGPTHDDITAECVAKAFGVPLVQHPDAFKALEDFYGLADLTPERTKMGLVPKGASLIPNPINAAPGFIIGNVHVMAGVPRVMQGMMRHVLEVLVGGKPILSSTVTCSLPESVIATGLQDLQARYSDVQIGSYPHYREGTYGLSVVARGTNEVLLEEITQALIKLIDELGDEPRALSIRKS
jgi:molybdenum cofactor synthesis domain-containing protein